VQQPNTTDNDDAGADAHQETGAQVVVEIPPQCKEKGQLLQALVHEYNLCCIGSDSGGAAQGDGDMRLLQRNRVVDTVADKTDTLSLVLQLLYQAGFVFGQSIGKVMFDAQALGQVARGRFLVAGDDVEIQPSLTQRFDRAVGLGTDGRRQFNGPSQSAVDADQDEGIALLMGSRGQPGNRFWQGDTCRADESRCSMLRHRMRTCSTGLMRVR